VHGEKNHHHCMDNVHVASMTSMQLGGVCLVDLVVAWMESCVTGCVDEGDCNKWWSMLHRLQSHVQDEHLLGCMCCVSEPVASLKSGFVNMHVPCLLW
jgi:hypothetical protein